MKHIVYKITNIENGYFYIGVHSTYNIDDGYLGSGKLIKRAVKKYGKDSFKKDILYVFESKDDAYQKEKDIVNKEFIRKNNVYNLALGGKHPRHLKDCHKDIKSLKKPLYKPTLKDIYIKCDVDKEYLVNGIGQSLKLSTESTFELKWRLSKFIYNGIEDIVNVINDKINNRYTYKEGVRLAKKLNEFMPILLTEISR